MNQLQRTFNNITFYCENITPNYEEAKNKRNNAKRAGFKARIIKLREDRKTVFGVFIN